MHHYISRKKDIQLVVECLDYQQTHHMALNNSDLTDTACPVVYKYDLLFCWSVMRSWMIIMKIIRTLIAVIVVSSKLSGRRRWPLSVLRDDDCTRVGHFWLVHLLVWLCRPMREWQSLPHRRAGVGCWCMSWEGRLTDGSLLPLAVSAGIRQKSWHSARLCYYWMPIAEHFMSLLQVSLYLSRGRPLDLAPDASSPYSRSLGMR